MFSKPISFTTINTDSETVQAVKYNAITSNEHPQMRESYTPIQKKLPIPIRIESKGRDMKVDAKRGMPFFGRSLDEALELTTLETSDSCLDNTTVENTALPTTFNYRK